MTFPSKSFQNGRSLIEILAVLAIVGFLTLVSVLGLSYLFVRQNANDTVGEANSRLWAIATSPNLTIEEGQPITIDGYKETSHRGYPVEQYYADDAVYAVVSDVPYNVCQIAKSVVGNRSDLYLDINVDNDGNSTDCKTDDAQEDRENELYFSLSEDIATTSSNNTGSGSGTGTGSGGEIGSGGNCTPPNTSMYHPDCVVVDANCQIQFSTFSCDNGDGYCDGKGICQPCPKNSIMIGGVCGCDTANHYVKNVDNDGNEVCECEPGYTDVGNNGVCQPQQPQDPCDGIVCTNGKVCSNGQCVCNSANHFIDDKDGGCKCDNGYIEKNGRCQRDLCANKQYTKCQTCDPLTGNIKDITLANCQICDPSTGDISTAADGSPCSIGFCKNGECPCGGNNHIEDTSLNRCESCSDLSTIYLNGSKDKPETCETLCNGKEDQYGRFSHRRYLNTYKHCVLAENSDFCHDQADGTHCTDKGKDGACINGYCALTHILTYQQAVQYCKDRGGLPSVEYLNSLGNFRSGTHIWTTNSVNPGTRVCVFAKSCTPNVQNGCENVSETYGCLAACKDDISPRNLYIEK